LIQPDPGAASVLPAQASTWAPHVDHVFLGLVAFSLLLAGGICVTMLTFAVRYRRRADVDRRGAVSGSLPLEVGWIVATTAVAMLVFWWGARGYVAMHRAPKSAYTVYVVGKQWMWKVLHPGGRHEIDALHVPVGQPVRLLLVSQDVIHSFFVPAFRLKQDALPDRYTSVWFEATRTGRFPLYCAEYCGLGHSRMTGEVTVMEPARFEAWLSAGAETGAVPGTPGTAGAALDLAGEGAFHRFGCNACHLPTSAVRAPRLDGLYLTQVRLRNGSTVVADEDYLRESILRPNAKITAGYDAPSLMPTYDGQLDEAGLAALVEFIKSIRHGWNEANR